MTVSSQTFGIKTLPEVGKACPYFELKGIKNFPKRNATLDDFKGKWLVLYFWGIGCAGCIASFPQLDQMQKDLKDQIQLVCIGINNSSWDRNHLIEAAYEKYRRKWNLSMTYAFDSVLCNQYKLLGSPHTIVLDNQGVVRAHVGHIDTEQLKELMASDESIDQANLYDLRGKFDYKKPLLFSDSLYKAQNFLYRSVFCKWDKSMPQIVPGFDFSSAIFYNGVYNYMGRPLSEFYNLAYFGIGDFGIDTLRFGKQWPVPLLELTDSSSFQADLENGENLYGLSMAVNLANRKDLNKEKTMDLFQKNLRQELMSAFGYSVTIETRQMPCWKLVLNNDKAKKKLLDTNAGAKTQYVFKEYSLGGFISRNYPIQGLIHPIYTSLHGKERIPVINETGITGNISVDMRCELLDFESIKEQLEKNGLDLVKGRKEMKVLVIRDPKPETDQALNAAK